MILKLWGSLRSWNKNVPNVEPENLKETEEQKFAMWIAKYAIRSDISAGKITSPRQ